MFLVLPAASGPVTPVREYLEYTDELHSLLLQVNEYWNHKVKYESDKEHYGRAKWAFPADGRGDCEDFALAKKQDLAARGIESFFATCRTKTGKPHIVLFVFTNRGALVLDMPDDRVRFAKDLPNQWTAVQFPGDVWINYWTYRKADPPMGYLFFKSGKKREN
jgi:predicted transglutaminase-like cysteine proteinase